MIHALASVHRSVHIPDSTEILQFTVVREGAEIGPNTRICSHCYIDSGVIIGEECKIKNGCYLYNGVRLSDCVFLGPGVIFTNDKTPDARYSKGPPYLYSYVGYASSIGAGSIILPGISVGAYARVGAGSIVTKHVLDGETWYGDPITAARRYK